MVAFKFLTFSCFKGENVKMKYIQQGFGTLLLTAHPGLNKSYVTTLVNIANSRQNLTLTFFEPLTSSDVLILIAKVKLNVLCKAVYLSRSIRPDKHPKIKC